MKTDIEIVNGPVTKTQCKKMLNSIGDALYVIGGKWKLRIIVALLDENKRFNELQRSLDGISAKVLSSELKNMEINGFVKRKIFTEGTVIVEYELTEYSQSLQGVLAALTEWGEMHKENIKESMRQKTSISSL